jgi:hypothetical protein
LRRGDAAQRDQHFLAEPAVRPRKQHESRGRRSRGRLSPARVSPGLLTAGRLSAAVIH